MSEVGERRVPGWYWAVAVAAVLWEGLGCAQYLIAVTQGADALPDWVMAVFAIAVWVGLAGAIALLLRRRLAVAALLVSLVAALVQYGFVFLVLPVEVLNAGVLAVPIAVLVAGGLLLWFARSAARRGWLR